MHCLECQKETKNPKFCSSSCSASYHNRKNPKRLLSRECVDCGKRIRYNVKRCKECFDQTRTDALQSLTLGEIRELYKDKTGMAVASKIRGYGKYIYNKSDKPKHCAACDYNKHYEVCHIRAIKNFPDTATMFEVHALDNLIALCPNCHWEFDRGLLVIK